MTQSISTFRKPIDKEANAMASKEVEVLDPAPTVEKLKKSAPERVLNRRHFIAALGVAGAAVAGTELVRSGPTALAQQPKPNGYAQSDVLNFLLNVKYLKATLYSYITQGVDLPAATFTNLGTGGVFLPPKQVTFTAAGPATAQEVTDLFNAMYYDEVNDLVTLRSILGSAVYPRQTMNLQGTGTSTATAGQTVTPVQAISLLRMLEDLSASAFAGATIYLTGTNLQYATQALAVNGFHAGALRLIAIQSGAPYYSPQDLTSTGPTTQTQNSFTASTVAGSTTIYNFAPTNPITTGSILTGPGIPVNTTITAVNPPTVYTGTLSGTATIANSQITNVAPTSNLAVGQAISGTGIPANSIITAISGTTITIGVVTGYSSLTPPTPITNGVIGVTGTGGTGMTVGTYPLAFSGGGGSGAAGTLTVLTATTFSAIITASGQGYTTAPTVTAATGGTPPTLTDHHHFCFDDSDFGFPCRYHQREPRPPLRHANRRTYTGTDPLWHESALQQFHSPGGNHCRCRHCPHGGGGRFGNEFGRTDRLRHQGHRDHHASIERQRNPDWAADHRNWNTSGNHRVEFRPHRAHDHHVDHRFNHDHRHLLCHSDRFPDQGHHHGDCVEQPDWTGRRKYGYRRRHHRNSDGNNRRFGRRHQHHGAVESRQRDNCAYRQTDWDRGSCVRQQYRQLRVSDRKFCQWKSHYGFSGQHPSRYDRHGRHCRQQHYHAVSARNRL
jgi:hypothetical protein